jgi:hypothetical protein
MPNATVNGGLLLERHRVRVRAEIISALLSLRQNQPPRAVIPSERSERGIWPLVVRVLILDANSSVLRAAE